MNQATNSYTPIKAIGIIPARYGSTRFPGKPLVDIGGKSMIQRVYEQALASDLAAVVVATDDDRILAEVERFGGQAIMTGAYENGTARCMAVFQQICQNNPANGYQVLVNIQGDEPFIQPQQINSLIRLFEQGFDGIGTLVKRIESLEQLKNPNVVKVVLGAATAHGARQALYFSRCPIPYVRDQGEAQWFQTYDFYHHIGLYAFHVNFALEQYASLGTGQLALAENLEQLAWLEQGCMILTKATDLSTPAIDHPDDVLRALEWLNGNGQG